MANKNPDYDGRFPGVDPIPEPDRPDHGATDMIDDVIGGILENKDKEEMKRENSHGNETVDRRPGHLPDEDEA
ncbi:hypothetical protein E6C60_1379 [Paenibacillus algicola]|uniref:Uncharacterized protein n=1 Tax=Paenibacillus algicola TaxID=2565926 RepID=A0A4P8XIA7_9BACL|nr:hypothetical protein [Paenibacillus algicola]QCT02095.1 hypothetical protein E6C60_1379 [Paenibacillus algicola]